MRLLFHGGMCCGIKHLKGFDKPENKVGAQEKKRLRNEDQFGYAVNSELDFFTDEAPVETQLQRLDRILAFVKKQRPRGIVEVVLAKGHYIDQPGHWNDILINRGFKVVNSCKNSNSGNKIFVYHLNLE